jgi:hypothetical protein
VRTFFLQFRKGCVIVALLERFPLGRGLMPMSLVEFLSFGIFLVELIGLVDEICHKGKKITAPSLRNLGGYFYLR